MSLKLWPAWDSLRLLAASAASFLSGWAIGLWLGAPLDLAVFGVVVTVTVGWENRPVRPGRRAAQLAGGLVGTAVLGWVLHTLVPGVFFPALAVLTVLATVVGGFRGGKTASRVLVRVVSGLLFFPAPMATHL